MGELKYEEMKGRIVRLDHRNSGTHLYVVPFEQRGQDSWDCVVAGGDDTVYQQGGYNIVVTVEKLEAGTKVDPAAVNVWCSDATLMRDAVRCSTCGGIALHTDGCPERGTV